MSGVITFWFDDGHDSQYLVGRPKLDQYNFPATLGVISDRVDTPSYCTLAQLQALERNSGWEMSCHAHEAAHHDFVPDRFAALPLDEAQRDWIDQKAWLHERGLGVGGGRDVYAYPGGKSDPDLEAAALRHFKIARTIDNTFIEGVPPSNPARVGAAGYVVNSTSLASLTAKIDKVKARGGWLIIVLHKIVPSPATSIEWSTANFEALVDYVAASGVPVRTASQALRAVSGGPAPEGDSVNVKNFRALGDGTTDDTVAIQAAIDTGRPVYLPPGSYVVGNLTGVRKLSGAGKSRTTLKLKTGISGTPIGVGSFTDVTVSDLTVDANGQAVNCFFSGSANGTQLERLRFVGIVGGGSAVQFTAGTSDCRAVDCTIVGGTPAFGIQMLGPGSRIVRCVSTGVGPSSAHFIVGERATAEGCRVRSIVAGNKRIGIGIGGSWATVRGCSVDLTGSTATSTSDLTAQGIGYTGTTFDDVAIIGNEVRGAAAGGIVVPDAVHRAIVANNQVYDCEHDGILCGTSTQPAGGQHTVVGNVIDGVTGGTFSIGAEDGGIEIQTDQTVVVGNVVRNCDGHGIWMSGNGGVVADNLVVNAAQRFGVANGQASNRAGVAISACSDCRVTNNVVRDSGSAVVEADGFIFDTGPAGVAGRSSARHLISGNRAQDTRGTKYQTVGLRMRQDGSSYFLTDCVGIGNDWTGNRDSEIVYTSTTGTLQPRKAWKAAEHEGGVGVAELNTAGLSSAQIDALFATAPKDGVVLSDPANALLLVRQGGAWRKIATAAV